MSKDSIFLAGFMGTGKTAVGHALAQILGRPFLDMDEIIAQRAGMNIPEIFANLGEGEFRRRETALCHELAESHGLVVATGGGTVVNPENRALLEKAGRLILLTCAPEEIRRRVGAGAGRPLLADNPIHRLHELLAERQEAYHAIPRKVDTTSRTPQETARLIADLWCHDEAPRVITVHTPSHDYPIILGTDLVPRLHDLIASLHVHTVALISDDRVGPLHAPPVVAALAAAGYRVVSLSIPAGEESKNLEVVGRLYTTLAQERLERHDVVVALGGGVVGDVAGFVAATFLRGLPFIQMPTTLLAQVDSSIGGKVGIDLPAGKNLVGAFKQPIGVVCDVGYLATVPMRELRAGFAEVAKHGIIGDPHLFAHLETKGMTALPWIVERAIHVKVRVVEEDPFEQDRRRVLNLGHTFGHALEVLSGYRLHHGEAVAVGIVAATRLACMVGWCPPQVLQRVTSLFEGLGLPTTMPGYSSAAVRDAMGIDKKRRDGRLHLVLPQGVGDVRVSDSIPDDMLMVAIRQMVEEH